MHTQQTLTTADRVTVWFQVGQIVVTDDGYRVLDSIHDTVELPAYRMATRLEGVVALRYPGRELIDWEIR